jgi:RNA polymerase sigma factor (sigma-70 family)
MAVHSSDVDEIVHDSLVEMCLWLKGCNPQKIRETNLKAYLYKIAENRVKVKQREYRRFDRPQFQDAFITEADIFDALIAEEDRPKGPEDVYLYKEWRQELLLHLPKDYREVFTAYLNGWSFQEIATYFDTTINSVKYIWRQCRLILQALPELRY